MGGTDNLGLLWGTAMGVCRAKGYRFTAECMENALSGGGREQTYYNDSSVFQQIKDNSTFIGLTNDWISIFKRTGSRSFSGYIEFTSGDLYFAIQHASIEAVVQSNGNMLVTITDVYNFDKMRNGLSIGSAGNNLGYLCQKAGIIHEFPLTIKGYIWAGNPHE